MLLFAVVACGTSGESSPPLDRHDRLGSDGAFIRDTQGRAVLLRGVNARVEGVFDVTFDDGRAPLEPIPPLGRSDCERMQALGFDFLRMPVSWSALEPDRGRFDEAYLDKVAVAAKCAGDAGVYVLVDMHQDAYSKEIGEDGAPLWAIQPPPNMLLGGPLTDLGARRFSAQVTAAFSTFFDPSDPAGVRAAFLDAFAHVAARFADDADVVGFEVFNEPLAGEDAIASFNAEAAARARGVAPKKLVFFEPSSVRNITDQATLATRPFAETGGVYAPHVYTHVFTSTAALATLTEDDLRPSIDHAHLEAQAWGTPLVIGEFGIGPTATNANAWVGFELDLMDEYFAGSSFWLWKEESQDSWGLFDHDAAAGTWTERASFVAAVSRPHASRIAGTPTGTTWDATTKTLTAHYDRTVDAPNLLWVGAARVGSVTCDGVAVPETVAAGLLSAKCGAAGDGKAHTLVVTLR